MDVAFLVELHKHTLVMRRRSEPPGRKVAQRKAFYYIRMTDGRCCNFANDRAYLLKWLKLLKEEEISDIRKLYKSGVSDSVLEIYRNYIRSA